MGLSVALVGCGHWGKNLARVFSELGVLSYVCDTDTTRRDSLRQVISPAAFTDELDDVLQDPAVGAVAIATPAATHYQVARRCLEAGKDIYVEKPLALTTEEAEVLVRMADDRSRILMVGHILLYHPAVVRLRRLIDDGELGRVLYCYSNRLNMGLIRTEENILWSFAPHDISVMLYLLQEEPIAVEAEGQSYLTPGVVDVTLSRLRFRSGVAGHIFVSWLHPVKEQRLVVVGTEKMAVFDDRAEEKLLLYPHSVSWAGPVPKAVKAEAVPVEIDDREPLKEECRHFLDCLSNRTTPLTDGEEGLRVLRVLDACQASLERQAAAATPGVVNGAETGEPYFVHDTACVDHPCSIGKGTKIWHFCHVMKGATIGEDCSLGQNVYVGSKAVIGNRVKIQNNVSVYDGVVVEDGVFCGPSMVFTNVINPRAEIARKNEYKKTLVKRGATLGANCTVICGNTIGEYALVAAGAVVTGDVPPFALVAGVPAKQIGWISAAGARLHFDGPGTAYCPISGRAYRLEHDGVRELDGVASKAEDARPLHPRAPK